MSVSIFSYAGEVTVGVMADRGLVPDPARSSAPLGGSFKACWPQIRRLAASGLARTIRRGMGSRSRSWAPLRFEG